MEVQKTNSFIVTLLSVLLLVSVFIAGFFAYKTQNLVKEISKLQIMPSPTAIAVITPEPKTTPVLLENLKTGYSVKNPLELTNPVRLVGSIDRSWTWEATFNIEILDDKMQTLSTSPVSVHFQNDEETFGRFDTTMSFQTNSSTGYLVIHADNPSGLPANDKSIKFPVLFINNQITACTMEAMVCPDGSAVGRSGPNCEFAPCPTLSPL